jgi:dTDP-4-amino-4,6-dideoxygalactose transaminase
MVPVNDLKRYARQVAPGLGAVALEVLSAGHYVLGASVAGFESAFAAYCGVAHCVGVANGTDAIEISLKAVGVGPGDRVAVAANAAMYGTTAILAAGASPLFADVSEQTSLIDARTLEAACVAAGEKPRAVIVTHLYGRLADMPAIMAWARARQVAVIEDCAQAHGARDAGGAVAGSFGDIGCFSFYPTKNLGAVGDAGAVVCTDGDIATRARRLRQYGWSRKYCNEITGGRNSRLDELQAAFLLALLPDLDRRNARRREIAARYSDAIRHPRISPPLSAPDGEDVAHLYVVRSRDRDGLARHLAAQGIATDVHYPIPDHRQPAFGGRYAHVSLPETERACSEVLTLPCFPELDDDEVERVIAACNAWEA